MTANDYFEYIGSDWFAADLTGTKFRELLYQVDQGRPVITWVTMHLWEFYPTYEFTLGCGEEFYFNGLQHCVTIFGYDLGKGIVYTADPLEGIVEYDIDQFELSYEIMGKQAVTLAGSEDTAGKEYSDKEEKAQWMHEHHPKWFGGEEDEDSEYYEYYSEYDNPVEFKDDSLKNVMFE